MGSQGLGEGWGRTGSDRRKMGIVREGIQNQRLDQPRSFTGSGKSWSGEDGNVENRAEAVTECR
jgi:hypothetical protein